MNGEEEQSLFDWLDVYQAEESCPEERTEWIRKRVADPCIRLRRRIPLEELERTAAAGGPPPRAFLILDSPELHLEGEGYVGRQMDRTGEARLYAMLDSARWTPLEPADYHKTWMAYTTVEDLKR